MKQIKYTNYWLEGLYFVFLYMLFVAALCLAQYSKCFYALPALAVLWKLFSYHIVLPDFVKGRRLRNEKRYEESLSHYRKCYETLEKKPWLDRYKFVLMASSLRISLVSVCLSNIADLHRLCERPGEARKAAALLCRLEPLGPVSDLMREKYRLPQKPVFANSFEGLKELLSATLPALEFLHIALCLFFLCAALFCSPSPWLVSLSAALIVGVYFFWRFGLPKLAFPGTDSPDDDARLEACLKALELLHRHPFLDRGRRILFLSCGRLSFRICFLAACSALYLLKEDAAKAEEYAAKIDEAPVRDELMSLISARREDPPRGVQEP